jgi:phage recombination protein Bet
MDMNQNLPVVQSAAAWTVEQVDLLKRTVAKGATDDEFKVFLHVCKRTGLDPFMKQIYCIKRWDADLGAYVMGIQTGIDGFRLQASRTKKYVPGREATFVEGKEGVPVSATGYVKILADDGSWHEVSATALYSEYVQKKKDGTPTKSWRNMPHIMLAKCAEALALRRAFPAELSGLHTEEEMGQADNDEERQPLRRPTEKPIDAEARVVEPPPAELPAPAPEPAPEPEPPPPPAEAPAPDHSRHSGRDEMGEEEVRPALEGIIADLAKRDGIAFEAMLDKIASFNKPDGSGRFTVKSLDTVFKKGTKWGRKIYSDARKLWEAK